MPHISMRAALKNRPSMPFGLGKKGRTTSGCEQDMASTLSSLSLESSRASSSAPRSESEYGTSDYVHNSPESVHPTARGPLVVPPLGTKILERFWPEDEPTIEDGDLAVRQESGGCWASYADTPGMGKEIPPRFSLTPPPSRHGSRAQSLSVNPTAVSDIPFSYEFPRQKVEFTVESQLRFPF
ncbi:hypothetical protein V8B97DRAFT_1323827 [Scleroderma yunnanense]